MLQTFSPDKRSKLTLRIFLVIIIIIGQVVLNSTKSYCQPHDLPEGVVFSINNPKGNKGLVLPKVELTDLSKYSPIRGNPIDGLLVENTHVDISNGLVKGLYIWNGGVWDRILDYGDLPVILDRIKIYAGSEDPNQSLSPEIMDSPTGSLYINTPKKIIFKKTKPAEDKPDIWVKDVSLSPIEYIATESIAINPVMETNQIQAIVGPGLKITDAGISVAVDSSTININQRGLIARNNEPIWNANKIQNTEIGLLKPATEDNLRYNGSKWLNAPGRTYTGINGIEITGDTISALIDPITLKLTNNHIVARNSDRLWNANQLQNTALKIQDPKKGDIIKYDGSKWVNEPEYKFNDGGIGIEILGSSLNAALDSTTMTIKDNHITVANEDALWNAAKLNGEQLVETGIPLKNQVLRYRKGKWTNTKELTLISGGGISIKDDTISALIDTATMSIIADRKIKIKNEDALWNADKLMGIGINKTVPKQGQSLRYEEQTKQWVPKKINEIPDGVKIGDIVTWNGSEWQVPAIDAPVGRVLIMSKEISLPNLAKILNKDDGDNKKDYFLNLSHGDNLVEAYPMSPWNIYGNKGLNGNVGVQDTTDYTLGINARYSNANIIIKTRNTERIKIESKGIINFNDTKNMRFTAYAQEMDAEQEQDDKLLMVDKSGKIKMADGIGWSNTGYNGVNTKIGSLGLISKEGNLVVKIANKDRIRIQAKGDISIKSDSLYIENLKNRDRYSSDFRLLVDASGKLFLWKDSSIINNESFALSRELKNGRSIIGFTDLKSPEDIVIRTQNHDRLRIERSGSIKMTLTDPVDSYDLVVIDPKSGELSKSPLDKILSRAAKHLTTTDSQTQIISISDITDTNTDLKDMGIDIAGPYGNTTIHIIYTDNKPEIAKIRYGTALLKVGYDNTASTLATLTHAYDITNNNKNLLANSKNIQNVNVGGVEVSFSLDKMGDTYKLIPNINKGEKTTGYLILRSKKVN